MAGAERWDIFCRVVDNFGDVGVAFRLARCLAREHGKLVRLFLDDLTVLARLRPDADPGAPRQRIDSVEVWLWDEGLDGRGAFPAEEVADVVVETFGCDTPAPYVLAMAGRRPHPRWINLEYLSAEDWVEGSHAMPSPPPTHAPLTRHFFFPGFTARTGGLLRERDLLARRDAFQADRGAQAEFWRTLAGAVAPDGALKVSLFGYAGAPFEALLEALARHHAGPAWIAAPEGVARGAGHGGQRVGVVSEQSHCRRRHFARRRSPSRPAWRVLAPRPRLRTVRAPQRLPPWLSAQTHRVSCRVCPPRRLNR